MNRKTIIIILTGILFLMIHSSCEDLIDVDLRSVEPKLVIEGTVRMGAPAEVLLTKTKDFKENNNYPPITDAIVTITDDAGNSEQLIANSSGKFVATTITGVERRTYNLSVSYEGQQYTATSFMPPLVEIDSLTQWKFPMVDHPDPMIHFKDPAGEENQYYRFAISINGEHPDLRDRLLSTEFIDGNIIHTPIFVRYEDYDDDDDDPIQQGDVVTIEMRCIDKGTYKFFETLSNIDNSLANPTSNIQGGALGYFGAYSYSSMDIKMEW